MPLKEEKLIKGDRIQINLSKIKIGLGWDPNDSEGEDFDLDVSAFMLNSTGKTPNEDWVVYWGTDKQIETPEGSRPVSPDNSVIGAMDDTGGRTSAGDDDEEMEVDFSKIDTSIHEIILTVTIHKAEERKQNFGQVRNSYIRVYDLVSGDAILKYELEEDFSTSTAVEFGRFYRKNNEWRFQAIGNGYRNGLAFFDKKYCQ